MSIIDLGLSAKVNRAGERLFFKGGSPAFMANETLENKKTSFAADIYSSMEIALNVLGCDSVSSWGDKDKEHSKLFKYAMDNVDNITKKEYKVAKTRLEELNDFLDIHDKIKFDRSLDQIYLSQDSHKHPPNFGFNGLTGPDYSITKQIENLFKTAQQMKDSMPNVEVPDVRFTPNQLKDVMTMMLNENPLARPSASELSEFFANYETMVLQLEVLERLKANEGLGLDSIDQVLSAQGVSPDILAQRFISMPLSSKVIQVKKWRVESSGEPNNKNKIREFSEKGEFTSEQQENLVNYLYNNERVNVISQFLSNWIETSKDNGAITNDKQGQLSDLVTRFRNNNNVSDKKDKLTEKQLKTEFNKLLVGVRASYETILNDNLKEFKVNTLNEISSKSQLLDEMSVNFNRGLCRKNLHAVHPQILKNDKRLVEIEGELIQITENLQDTSSTKVLMDKVSLNQQKSELVREQESLKMENESLKNESFPEQYANYDVLYNKKAWLDEARQAFKKGSMFDTYALLTGKHTKKEFESKKKVLKNTIKEGRSKHTEIKNTIASKNVTLIKARGKYYTAKIKYELMQPPKRLWNTLIQKRFKKSSGNTKPKQPSSYQKVKAEFERAKVDLSNAKMELNGAIEEKYRIRNTLASLETKLQDIRKDEKNIHKEMKSRRKHFQTNDAKLWIKSHLDQEFSQCERDLEVIKDDMRQNGVNLEVVTQNIVSAKGSRAQSHP